MLDTVTELHLAPLRSYPEYLVDSDEARAAVRQLIQTDLDQAEALRSLGERAAVIVSRGPSRFFDSSQRCRIELAVDDDEAADWVAAQLKQLAPFDATFELTLCAAHAPLLPKLRPCGLAPRMTRLHGDTQVALDGLRAGGIDRAALGDLRIEHLSTVEQVDAQLAMLRVFFRNNPGFGYLSPHIPMSDELQARIDAFVRPLMIKTIDARTGFVVLDGDEVLGHGVMHPRRDPILGHMAGMGLGFDPSIQGRGISKLLYEKLLQRMIELGVRTMTGRTANPAVLHLAKRMGRPVRAWQVEPA